MHALLISSDLVIYSKWKIQKSPITELSCTAVQNLIIINDEETEDGSQILTENSESDSEYNFTMKIIVLSKILSFFFI